MIGELVLGSVLVVSTVLNYLGNQALLAERRSLMNRVSASSPAEFIALEKATDRKPKGPPPVPPIGL